MAPSLKLEKPDQTPKPQRLTDGQQGLHSEDEKFWCDHQQWLQNRGYRLRSRYISGWVPSWEGTKKPWFECEDSLLWLHPDILDATRIADGRVVVLKLIKKSVHPFEVDIGRFLNSEPLASDPKNHCSPLLDVLEVPNDEDQVIIVMPLLRKHSDPRFNTVGEFVDFFRQVFEGLQFMHKHHVAHRDCMALNIMMDASDMYPQSFHPIEQEMRPDFTGDAKYYSRTRHPPKYYFTDYGISRRYNPTDGPPLEDPIWGGDKSVPEFHKSNNACDPFPTDVYYLGNMIREHLQGDGNYSAKLGLDFMSPLVADMVQDDPQKRPTMDEVVTRFEKISNGLSSWKLRSRVAKQGDGSVAGFFRTIAHWKRTIGYVFTRTPAVPTRK